MKRLTTTLCLTVATLMGLIFISLTPSSALAGKWKTVSQDETPVLLKGWPSDINWRFHDGGRSVDYSVEQWAVFGQISYREIKNRTFISIRYLNPGYYWGGGFPDDIRKYGWFNQKKGWFQRFADAKWESGQHFECYQGTRCNFRNLKFTVGNETCQWIFDNPDIDSFAEYSGRSSEPWAVTIIHCGDIKPFTKEHFERTEEKIKITYPGSSGQAQRPMLAPYTGQYTIPDTGRPQPYTETDRKRDVTAHRQLKLLAEQGDTDSQNKLGRNYDYGYGVPEDHKTAVKWYTLAAEQGHADAQFNLGWMYHTGKGVPQNDKTAVKWYRLAAEQGHASAQNLVERLQKKIAEAEVSPPPRYQIADLVAGKQIPSVSKKKVELARRTQKALLVLGLYSGKLDGIIGTGTRAATRRWQERNGYTGTGEITETQLARMEQEATTRLAKKEAERKQSQARKEPAPTPRTGTSGSGFFVSRLGHVVTNQHIVTDCREVTVGDKANRQVTAKVLETDRRNDLALLRISSTKMASTETKSLISKLGIKVAPRSVPLVSDDLLRSEDVELGEDVLVAGYPYGELFSSTIKVTKGIISSTRGIGDDSGQFQMDAAVQPGTSGGPIYDENGNIIGVVVSQLNKRKFEKIVGSLPENVNFGIKASTVKQFLTSAGLPTKWSGRSKSMSTRDLAKIARNQTVMVVCHR